MLAQPLRFRHLLWALATVAVGYALYGAWLTALRVQYPYDHLIWSESPFLTNMLKLHNDVELYGPPADTNSFVYSPGLELACYALLAPLGLHLDVRACRVVNVGFALAAMVAAGSYMLAATRTMATAGVADRGPDRTAVALLLTATAGLVLFKNFTFDLCHPDNLHALAVAGGIALAERALTRESLPLAIATAGLLGLSILVKQTAALTGVGVGVFLAWSGWRRWGPRRSLVVVAAAVATTSLAAWWLLVYHPHGRFWLFDVLVRHPKYLTKLEQLWGFDALMLHRAPLWLGALFVALRGLFGENARLRASTGLWLFGGAFGALPALSAYIKEFGLFNNLVAIDLWAALLVVPTLITWAESHLDRRPRTDKGIVAAAALTLVTLGLYPNKEVPRRGHLRYGRELEAALTADRAAHRRVLVAHGTAAWIRAGLREVPLDRSNSALELVAGRHEALSDTYRRVLARHYDRIYVGWPGYGPLTEAALQQEYTVVDKIRGVSLRDPAIQVGWSTQMVADILIYEPRPPALDLNP